MSLKAKNFGDLFASYPDVSDILDHLDYKTGVMREAFSTHPAYQDLMFAALRHAFGAMLDNDKIRIWRDETRLSFGQRKALAETIQPSETFESWTRRVFDGQDFCIVALNFESFHEELALATAQYIRPVVQRASRGTSFSIGTFTGRYAFSPLGLHQDANIDRVLHFHTGPGVKRLHSWDVGQIHPDQISRYPDAGLLACAQSYDVRPGDILNIETPVFHIGEAPELCTNLNLICRQSDPISLLTRFGAELSANWQMPSPKDPGPFPEPWLEKPLHHIMETVESLYRTASLSNGGLGGMPTQGGRLSPVQKRIQVKAKDLFPVLAVDCFNRPVIAARGRVRYAPEIKGGQDWIEMLVAGHSVATDDLLSLCQSSSQKIEASLFIQWLISSQGVSIKPDA